MNNTEETGLPWFKSWRGIYLTVLGILILWIVLLTLLDKYYS